MASKQTLRRKKLIISILLSAFSFSITNVRAQETTQLNGLLNYPLSNSLVLHGFGNNPSEMDRLNLFMNRMLGDSTITISDIQITGYSSPDGPFADNKQLACERVIHLKEYLDRIFNLSVRDTLSLHFVPEDWDGLQRQLAAADYPQSKEIVRIIDSTADSEKREQKIKKLHHGRVYRDLCNSYFPLLRRVEINVKYIRSDVATSPSYDGETPAPQTAENGPVDIDNSPESYIIAQRQTNWYSNEQTRRHREQVYSQEARYSYTLFHQPADFFPQIAVKTNLLALAGVNSDLSYTTCIPNLSIEAYFKKRWSAELSMAYSNWSYRHNTRFQGLSAYTLEIRYWLKGNKQFEGFFAGVYAQSGDYNLQKHHNVLSLDGNRTGRYHSEGFSLGYLQPLYNRLSAEVSIRIGYRHANVKEYKRDADLNQYKDSQNEDKADITGSRLNIVYRF
ncbi:DUF3575 domain-containing protein [uncultured Bacteroides sp.]|uniref:DUF3575 domain-containing protein n=1 Tax=uncultured Bacteroides sp. TaxID=162156 RepID=UPI002AA723D4|nr:DUF3575 domain-containing protein [uncultured Bacteroides sp.]